jgi:anti-sigma regulatory factor (Ser/Thr protein kinase)
MRYDYESGFTVAINDSSQVGEARRSAAGAAAHVGLSETDAGKLAILVTEAATNIAKHATRGEIVLRAIAQADVRGVELIAIDSGPGIANLDRALTDGYSTAGSPGAGLGAFSRLATRFDIFSVPGAGTVLSARIDAEPSNTRRARSFEVGVVRASKHGEPECGDDWGIVWDDDRAVLTVADGLGHGPAAAEASRRAVEIAAEHSSSPAGTIVAQLHAGLRSTRGAALAVAELNVAESSLRFAGLGNISASVVSAQVSKSLVSHNGIAGHEMRKIQEFSYDWPGDALLIMHSDGLSSRWDLSKYPGLALRDPSVVAGVLYRDYSRVRDDALVVVVRTPSRDQEARWR